MHIPNQMLSGQICPITAGVALLGIAGATYFAAKSETKPTVGKFAATTAFIFAAQMANFPIANGTSGHFLGGVFAAAVLGTPFGILAVSLVVAIQSLVFADGGLTVLGANVLNMGIVGAGVSGIIYSIVSKKISTKLQKVGTLAAISWLSVVMASSMCSFELALSGIADFGKVFQSMVSVHSIIGLFEAVITVMAVSIFAKHNEGKKWNVVFPIIVSFLTVLLVVPFASSYPDGLEWVAEKYSLIHSSAPTFVTPFADYTVWFVKNITLSLVAAGFVGVVLILTISYIVGIFVKKLTEKRIKI